MKRLILPTIILCFAAIPASVLAASGACSYHGGVDCSAGPQADGNVICNDGWVGSSVAYSSMAECSGTSSSVCTYPVAACSNGQLAALEGELGQTQEEIAQLGIEQTSPTEAQGLIQNVQNQITQCQQEIGAYNSAILAYNSCTQSQKLQDQIQTCQAAGETWVSSTETCLTVCPSGYIGSAGVCQITEQQCINNIGSNSHVVGTNQCACDDGYAFASSTGACMLAPAPQIQPQEPTATVSVSNIPSVPTPTSVPQTQSPTHVGVKNNTTNGAANPKSVKQSSVYSLFGAAPTSTPQAVAFASTSARATSSTVRHAAGWFWSFVEHLHSLFSWL